MADIDRCSKCGASGSGVELEKCPICFQKACRACAVNVSGRWFCSMSCSQYFFHGDDDDVGRSGDE